MKKEPSLSPDRPTLHYVDCDMRQRAGFAQLAMVIAHHCEVYDNIDELISYPPRQGVIFLRDTASIGGGFVTALETLQNAGIWLSAVAVGDTTAPAEIVAAIKAGALDYLVLPLEEGRLERCLTRITKEASLRAIQQRRKIEARKLLACLSARESEILDLVVAGNSNKLIGRTLGISPRTVEIHRRNMMHKLGKTHPADAVRLRLEVDQFVFG